MGVHINPFTGKLDVVDSPSGEFTDLTLDAGTASVPSISFDGDPNTGFYSPGADQVAISTNGTGRLFVDASGNVGVGGSASNYSDHKSLFLFGAANNGAGFLQFNDTSNNADAAIFADDGSLFINADYDNTSSNSSIRFRVDGSSEKMRITSDGKLGLGTSSPTSSQSGPILHIRGANAGIKLNNTGGGGWGYIEFSDETDTVKYISGYRGSNNTYNICPGTTLVSDSGLHVDSSGRLGLGTSSPQAQLHLSKSGTSDYTTLRFSNTGASGRNYEIGVGGSTSAAGYANNLYFYDGTASSVRMVIDSLGRVGVGTTSPGELLSVNGNINITSTNRIKTTDSGGRLTIQGGGTFPGGHIALNGGSGSDNIIFNRSGASATSTETARIDSSGRLLVGTSSTSTSHLLQVNGPSLTSWFACDSKSATVSESATSTLTISGTNPMVQVYIRVFFVANGGLNAFFDYNILTSDTGGSGGGAAIRQTLNESVGSFQVSTTDFAVTRSANTITITYTNQPSGVNGVEWYVNGKFTSLSIA